MMNQTHGWISRGMWSWTAIGTLLTILIVVAVIKVAKK
jgi:hypothetical protein